MKRSVVGGPRKTSSKHVAARATPIPKLSSERGAASGKKGSKPSFGTSWHTVLPGHAPKELHPANVADRILYGHRRPKHADRRTCRPTAPCRSRRICSTTGIGFQIVVVFELTRPDLPTR